MNGKILIIPDVHGRTFWKEALDTGEYDKIIFLGDYVDPYFYEGINTRKAIANFKDILSLKKAAPAKVVLLLGNHDMGYLSDYYQQLAGSCRHDYENEKEIQKLFRGRKRFFQLAYEETIGSTRYLFTHAGVTQTWLHQNSDVIVNTNAENLNRLLKTNKGIEALGQVGTIRGGSRDSGSMVWADVEELANSDPLPDTYQIVGHSMQFDCPIIEDKFACLDCRAAFSLNDKGCIQLVTELTSYEDVINFFIDNY